jgi:hypothetical protein
VTFISIHYVIIYGVFFGACMRCTRLCSLKLGVTLCHHGAVDPSRLLTNLSRVTNKISMVITELPTPPSHLGDVDHQE